MQTDANPAFNILNRASNASMPGSASFDAAPATAGASFSSALDGAQSRLASSAAVLPGGAAASIRVTGATPERLAGTRAAAAEAAARPRTAAQQLAEYASKSVAERVREAVLKDMGLTEEDLKAMDPEKRAAIEEEIARRVKAALAALGQPGAKRGDERVGDLSTLLAIA